MITAGLVLYNNSADVFNKVIQSLVGCEYLSTVYIFDNSECPLSNYIVKSPKIEYVHSELNVGFGAGHNHILQMLCIQSTYHLIVNPDIEFDCAVLHKLQITLDQRKQIVAIMPRIKNIDGTDQHLCKKLPTVLNLMSRRFLPFGLGSVFQRGYVLPYLDELFITPTISGCFLMCRTEKLIGIGGFDGRFFMYMEDVDLCRRLWSVGTIACLPTVAVFHGYAAGSYKNLKLLRYHVKSAICYFRKWGIFPDRELNSINKLAGSSLDITDLD